MREQAKGAADARLLQAQAEAKAIGLQGEAQATAIHAQADALKSNPTLIDLRKAERWDGKLPTAIYAGAPIPFFAHRQADGGAGGDSRYRSGQVTKTAYLLG